MQTSIDQTQKTKQIRLFLIEEHPDVRDALSKTLTHQLSGLTLWTTPYLPSRPEEIIEFQPDVVLIGLPQQAIGSVQTLADQIRYWTRKQIPVIVLTTFKDLDEVTVLQQAGAFATVLKESNSTELLGLIVQAAQLTSKEKIDV